MIHICMRSMSHLACVLPLTRLSFIHRRILPCDNVYICGERNEQTHTYFPLIVSVIINTEHPGRGFGIALSCKLNPAFVSYRDEERGEFVSSVSAFALRPSD